SGHRFRTFRANHVILAGTAKYPFIPRKRRKRDRCGTSSFGLAKRDLSVLDAKLLTGWNIWTTGQAMPEHSGDPLDKDEVVRNLRDAPGQPLIGERSLATSPAPELTIVIPTFNERDNIPVITERLRTLLAAVSWEIIFVDDDSPDGSAALTKELGAHDQRIRCIRRLGRRGLAGACIEGMLASQATFAPLLNS